MSILRKGTKPYSILHMKCPKCHEGDLFETGSFSFKRSFDMPKHCPKCGQKYFLEPGFYYGAMFVSYFLTGMYCLVFVGLLMLAFGVSWQHAFIFLLLTIALLFVWIFRISRTIWINVNVRYDPKAIKQRQA